MYPPQQPLNFGALRKRRLGYGQDSSSVGQDPMGQDPLQIPDEQDDEQDNEVGTPIPGEDKFSQIFKAAMAIPPGEAESRYAEHLAKGVPREEDFKPGKVNRLAAILGGASEGGLRGAGAGIRTASEILDSPYQKGVAAYKMQSDALAKAAQVESSMFGRKASFARTAAQQAAAEARNRMLGKHYDAADRAALIRAKAAGYTKVTGSDGHTYLIKPNEDGTVNTLDGGKHGESLPEKTKREIEKFKVEEGVRQGNRVTNMETQAGITGVQRNKDKAADLAIAGQTQAAIDARNAANPQRQNEAALLSMRKSYAAHPEVAKYLEFQKDAQGNATQIPIALKPGDPDDPVYKALYKDVYGKKK